MTGANVAAQCTGKVIRVNPKCPQHKEKKCFLCSSFFSFYCIHVRQWMLAEPVVIISQLM